MNTWAEINAKKYGDMAVSMIQAAGLNLEDFVQELWPPSFRIVHQPTQNYFAFGGEVGGAVWTRPGYQGGTQQTGTGHPEAWDRKIRHFGGWLGQLKEFLTAIAEHSKGKTAVASPPIAPEPEIDRTKNLARFRISGPDDVELLLEEYADGYVWKFQSNTLHDIDQVRFEILDARSFDPEKHAFRKSREFIVRWPVIRNLRAGDQTKGVRFFAFEGDHLEFGKVHRTGELFWPSGDLSTERRWLLSMKVIGLSKEWPIELDLRWTVGTHILELREYSGEIAIPVATVFDDAPGSQTLRIDGPSLGSDPGALIPGQEFPRFMHHASEPPRTVSSAQEEAALGPEWSRTYMYQAYPKVKYHWIKEPKTVKNAEEEAALGGGWANTPAAFESYKGPRPAGAEYHPERWVDEWPVTGLSADGRNRIKAQLWRADSEFWKSPDTPSTAVDAMRLAFDGVASVLFSAGILTEQLLRDQIPLLVWDSAIAAGWWRLASETPQDMFREQLGHYWVWREEGRDWSGLFRSETGKWRAQLLEHPPTAAKSLPADEERDTDKVVDTHSDEPQAESGRSGGRINLPNVEIPAPGSMDRVSMTDPIWDFSSTTKGPIYIKRLSGEVDKIEPPVDDPDDEDMSPDAILRITEVTTSGRSELRSDVAAAFGGPEWPPLHAMIQSFKRYAVKIFDVNAGAYWEVISRQELDAQMALNAMARDLLAGLFGREWENSPGERVVRVRWRDGADGWKGEEIAVIAGNDADPTCLYHQLVGDAIQHRYRFHSPLPPHAPGEPPGLGVSNLEWWQYIGLRERHDLAMVVRPYLEDRIAHWQIVYAAPLPDHAPAATTRPRAPMTAESSSATGRAEPARDFTSEENRNSAVAAYSASWDDCSEAALARTASVDPADLSKWKRGLLPSGSDKKARIEKALRNNEPPTPPANRPKDS